MLTAQRLAKLAIAGRARVVGLDMQRGVAMVRVAAPRGGSPAWPHNVVALRPVAYALARAVRGLVG